MYRGDPAEAAADVLFCADGSKKSELFCEIVWTSFAEYDILLSLTIGCSLIKEGYHANAV